MNEVIVGKIIEAVTSTAFIIMIIMGIFGIIKFRIERKMENMRERIENVEINCFMKK